MRAAINKIKRASQVTPKLNKLTCTLLKKDMEPIHNDTP